MTYAIAPALQKAVFERLSADPGVTALVGGAIYDAIPPGLVGGTYVSLGPEEVRDASDDTGYGAWHVFTVSVVTDEAGFSGAKAIATAISDALVDAPLSLERGQLVALNFHRARAERVQDADMRRIDLRFRARVDDS